VNNIIRWHVLKKSFIKLLYFFALFILISVLVFEVAFRFFSPEFFISILSRLSYLGVGQGFDSLFVFLLTVSFLLTSVIYLFLKFIAKSRVVE